MLPDIGEREIGVARRLLSGAVEIAHDLGIDEIIVFQHAAMRSSCRFGANNSVSEEAIASSGSGRGRNAHRLRPQSASPAGCLRSIPRKPCRGRALRSASASARCRLPADVAVMVLDTMPPFQADFTVAKARDHHRILDRDRGLVIVAVQRPGLHLALVELAAVQQPMERMQAVIAGGADMAQRGLQLFGVLERTALPIEEAVMLVGQRRSQHDLRSVGGYLPARLSAILRSAEPGSSAGFELLICRNIFLSISRPASASIAPVLPDIEICPMPCPVLVPRPAATFRHRAIPCRRRTPAARPQAAISARR